MWGKKKFENEFDKIMFFPTDTLEGLTKLSKDIHDRNLDKMNSIVSCDKCKHLIYKTDAIKGESRIVKEYPSNKDYETDKDGVVRWSSYVETVQETHLCPNCVPKKGKK